MTNDITTTQTQQDIEHMNEVINDLGETTKKKPKALRTTKKMLTDLCKAQEEQLVQMKLSADLFNESYGMLLTVILTEYPNKAELIEYLKNHDYPQVVGLTNQITSQWAEEDSDDLGND